LGAYIRHSVETLEAVTVITAHPIVIGIVSCAQYHFVGLGLSWLDVYNDAEVDGVKWDAVVLADSYHPDYWATFSVTEVLLLFLQCAARHVGGVNILMVNAMNAFDADEIHAYRANAMFPSQEPSFDRQDWMLANEFDTPHEPPALNHRLNQKRKVMVDAPLTQRASSRWPDVPSFSPYLQEIGRHVLKSV
jgi:hypothetical protein